MVPKATGNTNNLTLFEGLGLNGEFNLADGHAHQAPTETQKAITNRLTQIWYEAQATTQEHLEKRFKEMFFQIAGQYSAIENLTSLSYSASVTTEIIANYLKLHNYSVTLIHPTFDNIADILRRVGVPLKSIDEDEVRNTSLLTLLESMRSQALFLVVPNNPTGFTFSKSRLQELVEYAVLTDTLLIFDFCFRFFDDPLRSWDQYELLVNSRAKFITIEDVGKSWPTLDIKVGITSASESIYPDLNRIHSDVLLNVSPFTLQLLLHYLEDTRVNGIQESVQECVRVNRRELREAIVGTCLESRSDSETGVEWLRITSPSLTAQDIWGKLALQGVYVLPGSPFFWADPARGDKFIRVALMRDTKLFARAVRLMREVLMQLA